MRPDEQVRSTTEIQTVSHSTFDWEDTSIGNFALTVDNSHRGEWRAAETQHC